MKGNPLFSELLLHTRHVFLLIRVLHIPFWAIFNLLPFILYKELGATPFQITLLIALKPISALLSPYWSATARGRRHLLKANLISANLLKYFPFLFFPWLDSVWLIIFAHAILMVMTRGTVPAWMEIIKLHIDDKERHKIFAFGSAIDYLGSAILPFFFGWLMDAYLGSWRWIFFSTALLGTFSTLILTRLPTLSQSTENTAAAARPRWHSLLIPLQDAWVLMRDNVPFRHFQWGFMLGGAGLMVMHPALPLFFVDQLSLSYTEMFFALTVCKGIGFALTTPLWTRQFSQINIFFFCCIVTIFAALFPAVLLGSYWSLLWLYSAYILYGAMQAGSELSWHMSGLLFAGNNDSTPFSSTNVLTVGIRGCVAPLVGSLLCTLSGASATLLFGGLLCMMGTGVLWRASQQHKALCPAAATAS